MDRKTEQRVRDLLLAKCGAEIYNFVIAYDLYFERFFDEICNNIANILDGIETEGGRIPTDKENFETVVRAVCYNLLLRKMEEYGEDVHDPSN